MSAEGVAVVKAGSEEKTYSTETGTYTTDENGRKNMDVIAKDGNTITLSLKANCTNDQYLRYEWVDTLGRVMGSAATLSVTAEENAAYTGRVIDSYGNRAVVVFHVLTDQASLADAQITLSQTHYPFDGKAKKPAVTVVLKGKTLTAGRDYTVSYKNNVDPGIATVTVKGRTVKGSKEVNFTIGSMAQTPVASVDEIVVAVGKTANFTVSGSHTPLSAEIINNSNLVRCRFWNII
jgi:hypothetical protein